MKTPIPKSKRTAKQSIPGLAASARVGLYSVCLLVRRPKTRSTCVFAIRIFCMPEAPAGETKRGISATIGEATHVLARGRLQLCASLHWSGAARRPRAPQRSAPSRRAGCWARAQAKRMLSADGAGGDGGARLMAAQTALR